MVHDVAAMFTSQAVRCLHAIGGLQGVGLHSLPSHAHCREACEPAISPADMQHCICTMPVNFVTLHLEQKGVLVRHVKSTYETAKHLRPDDIIMKFDGIQVASDGKVSFRCCFRVPDCYVNRRQPCRFYLTLTDWS